MSVIYRQDFESGQQPPQFSPWEKSPEQVKAMWAFQPAINGQFSLAVQEAAGFDIGAFCQLPALLNELAVEFSFRASAYPVEYGLEIVDLYDANGNEVFDVYLNPSGQLTMTVGGSMGSISKPVPINQTIKITLRLSNASLPVTASLEWSQANGPLGGEIYGCYRTDGNSTAPISKLLFGPVEAPIVFEYDDLIVTTP